MVTILEGDKVIVLGVSWVGGFLVQVYQVGHISLSRSVWVCFVSSVVEASKLRPIFFHRRQQVVPGHSSVKFWAPC